jgi:hypothetical protein
MMVGITLFDFSVWLGLKLIPEPQTSIVPLLNTFVHIFMYGYYFVTSLGIKAQWKKYVTALQLTQFSLLILHSMLNFVFGCDYPGIFTFIISTECFGFFVAFKNFYDREYAARKKQT